MVTDPESRLQHFRVPKTARCGSTGVTNEGVNETSGTKERLYGLDEISSHSIYNLKKQTARNGRGFSMVDRA